MLPLDHDKKEGRLFLSNRIFLCLAQASISDNSSNLQDLATLLNIAAISDTVSSVTFLQVLASPDALTFDNSFVHGDYSIIDSIPHAELSYHGKVPSIT